MARKATPDAFAGTPEEQRERASGPILNALRKAEDEFNDWEAVCFNIDEIYSLHGSPFGGVSTLDVSWRDAELDLFWASFEILKPAVYARPPRPAVKPLFTDATPTKNLTAELLERAATSAFVRTGMGDVMCEVRDDLLFAGRGVMWLRYESEGGQKVCVEHLDRTDFRHEPARKWAEVGWVAGGFWLTRDELKKRFKKLTESQLDAAKYTLHRDDQSKATDQSATHKCRVWEVWHKADNRVYWVTEGIDVLLDDGEPHLKLEGFFPCPRPAYGTLRRRSLIPVPDWERYAIHFKKISDLTARIYGLLNAVKMKGITAGGGDVASAVKELLESDDDQTVIQVPTLATDAGQLVAWLPLAEVATAITGLIEARGQLINDFYELSGISDIMRGATEAEETLGAQQLKSQYGSVRVQEKIDELQRIAADAVKIAAEIIAEKFSKETLLEMAQMEIPSKRDIEKRIDEIEKAAEEEIKALGAQAKQMAAQDPAQAQAALQQAQQAIFDKYRPMLAQAEQQVPIEDVMALLRDDRARSFAFEIESDSTILTDELQEKQSRGEFLTAFNTASQGLMNLAAMGEPGAKLAGEMLKFALAPFRAGRQLDGAIDAFIEAAPQMAAAAAGQEGDEGLAEAQAKLAEAEMEKAKAAMAAVEAKAALDKAEMQRKMLEMQQKAQEAEFKAAAESEKLRQSLSAEQAKTAHIEAQINKLTAETAAILNKIGLDVRQQELAEYQAAEQSQQRQVDNAMAVQDRATETQFREREDQRADRGEDRADRQQQLAEREPRP
jgi:hypothetical protein